MAVLTCPGASDLRGGQRPRRLLHGSAHPQGTAWALAAAQGRELPTEGDIARLLGSKWDREGGCGLLALLQLALCCLVSAWGSPDSIGSSWASSP